MIRPYTAFDSRDDGSAPSRNTKWRWSLLCAFAMALLSLCPQILMWGVRGRDWNGAYAQVNGDEWLYSAYVQALIDGRPRRNDPYTGRDDTRERSQPESVFSIQFIPAYMIAITARVLRLSASSAFIALAVFSAVFLCMALHWLVFNLTQDHLFAAATSVITICFGGLAARSGVISLWGNGFQYFYLPFLRRYEPAAMIPLFFLFCSFVFKSFRGLQRRRLLWAIAAGLSLDLLLFSYLYLWTTAIAWLFCLVVLSAVANRRSFFKDAQSWIIIVLFWCAGLVPYVILLANRSVTLDSGQKLTISHAPDLGRFPELIGIVTIILLVVASLLHRIKLAQFETLFTGSLSLVSVLVFNQQLLTGRSLQPFHFEMFIVNYVAVLAAALTVFLVWRGLGSTGAQPSRSIRSKAAIRLIVIAFWWGFMEVLVHSNVIARESRFIDDGAAICQRLRVLSKSEDAKNVSQQDPRPLVFSTDYDVSLILPTFSTQAVLWSPNFDFINLQPGEYRVRLYKYLYYLGMTRERFAEALAQPMSTWAAVTFGHERVLPDLAVNVRPITTDEIQAKVADYSEFCARFSREDAATHKLAYVIGAPTADFQNIDRWYQRDAGERFGSYILYRVHLR